MSVNLTKHVCGWEGASLAQGMSIVIGFPVWNQLCQVVQIVLCQSPFGFEESE